MSQSFFSPGDATVSSISASLASAVPSSPLVSSMHSLWDDELISKFADKGWRCGYCGGTWINVNSSRVIRHLVPSHPTGTGIVSCSHDLVSFSTEAKNRWVTFAASQTVTSERRRVTTESAALSLTHRTSDIADSIHIVGTSKRFKESDDSFGTAERRKYNQMSIQASLHQNGDVLTAAIANFVHSEGLPFSIVDKPTFHVMLNEARFAPVKYKVPNRKMMGGNLLDITYETYFAANMKKLNDGIEMYGICLYGDSATIKRKPFLNILAASVKEPSIVLEIADATDHLKEGGKKDSSYVAGCFIPWCRRLDPDNKFLDCVFFDGAGDVQKAGKLLAARNPRIAVLHGAEHVVSLFCKDVAKLTPIHIVVLKYRFLYRVFGSGSMHRPYAVFQKAAKEFNHGRKIGLLKPADTRMAGYFIALHRLLRLQKPLQSAQASFEWENYKFPTKNKQQKESIEAIVKDPVFWHEVETIVRGMFPVLKCLRLADSNAAGMDKLYYYVRRTSEALHRNRRSFNGEGNCTGFEYRKETHTALGNRANVSEGCYAKDLRYCNHVDHDLDFDEDDDEGFDAGFEEDCVDGPDMDVDMEDEDSVLSHSSTASSKQPPSLQKGLGDHIVFLWEKRKTQLISDFAVLGWMVSVVPEIMLDAQSYNHKERGRAEDALKKLWHPQSAIELDFQTNLNKFFSELGFFHRKEGPYENKRIWNDTHAMTGQSHLWHNEHTVRFNYMSLGFTACRVASKILGIGAAERSWGDVKRIIGDRRLSLGSQKVHRQSVIYTSNCIQAKKRVMNVDEDTWKVWDLAMDSFNLQLEQHAVDVQRTHSEQLSLEPSKSDEFFGHFIQSGGESTNRRLFRAYEEKTLEQQQNKQDSVLEASIIAKYGGLYLADPNMDGHPQLLKINSKRVYYQADKRGQNRKYCVYGMMPGEITVTKNTELFVVDNDLITRVICAENKNLNVVDAEGVPVIAATYRQNEFLVEENICWDFVKVQKREFLSQELEEDSDGDEEV